MGTGHANIVPGGWDNTPPGAESEAERGANGVPCHPEVVEWFRDICGELSVPYNLTDG